MTHSPASAPHRGAFLALAALAAGAALAQTQPAPRVVSRDELRACMATEATFPARRQALQTRNQMQNELGAQLQADTQALEAEKKDAEGDARKMERFNRKVKAHNEKFDAARAALAAFNADMEALNKDIEAHNAKCAAIAFRPEDREAILKERAAN